MTHPPTQGTARRAITLRVSAAEKREVMGTAPPAPQSIAHPVSPLSRLPHGVASVCVSSSATQTEGMIHLQAAFRC